MSGKQRRGRWQYKIYRLKNPPNTMHAEKVARTAEETLLADLAVMDNRGWEIAHVFPTGTHFLMRRERTDWKAWTPADGFEDDDAGKVDDDPKEQQQ